MARSHERTRWVEISVEADRGSVDDVTAFLGRYCVGGAVVEDRPSETAQQPGERVIVKGFLPVWDEETRRKLEIALLLLGKVSPISEPVIRILEPEDWAESWKAYFPPQHIGRRTVIVPTWREYAPQPDEIIIQLDPGMAFGTGLHATTRLCLAAIERVMRPGMSVLDVGTGSGILAIAAALQGAGRIQALDVDQVAVEVAKENVLLNHVENVVQVERGTLGQPPAHIPHYTGTGYELLLANILAEIIIDMAEGMARALAPSGLYVASGILLDKSPTVEAALKEAGLTVDEQQVEDNWVALIGHKD